MMDEELHRLSKNEDGGYTCSVCLWRWKYRPRSACPGLPHYEYGCWPEHLYTFTQLRRLKLKPAGAPAGCYFMMRSPYRRYLYDIRQAVPRRILSARQREAVEKMRAGLVRRYTCSRCGYFDASQGKGKYGIRVYRRSGLCENCERLRYRREQQARICAWAHEYLQQREFIVIDSETTGLNEFRDDEIIELAIVHSSGAILFSSLIQPQDPNRHDLATHIHGITGEMLQVAPRFPGVWPTIRAIIRRYRNILVYNAAFDHDLLDTTARRYGYRVPRATWTCLMHEYAVYHGAWHSYWRSYTWQKLMVACECLGVPLQGEHHRALADALHSLGVLKALAALHGHIELLPPPPVETKDDFFTDHPF